MPEDFETYTVPADAVLNVLTIRAATDPLLAAHIDAARWQVAAAQNRERANLLAARLEAETEQDVAADMTSEEDPDA
jgi:hypothetical protein